VLDYVLMLHIHVNQVVRLDMSRDQKPLQVILFWDKSSHFGTAQTPNAQPPASRPGSAANLLVKILKKSVSLKLTV
jgi:hypothetical protein